jgi:hypothetical protein
MMSKAVVPDGYHFNVIRIRSGCEQRSRIMSNVQSFKPCAEGPIAHSPYASPQHLVVRSQSCQIHPLPAPVSTSRYPKPSTGDHIGAYNLSARRIRPERNPRREGERSGTRIPLCWKAPFERGLPVLLDTANELPADGKHGHVVLVHGADAWCWTRWEWIHSPSVCYQTSRAAAQPELPGTGAPRRNPERC